MRLDLFFNKITFFMKIANNILICFPANFSFMALQIEDVSKIK